MPALLDLPPEILQKIGFSGGLGVADIASLRRVCAALAWVFPAAGVERDYWESLGGVAACARSGNFRAARLCLDRGPPDAPADADGCIYLFKRACLLGDVATVERLFAFGGWELPDECLLTGLKLACKNDRADMFRFLVRAKPAELSKWVDAFLVALINNGCDRMVRAAVEISTAGGIGAIGMARSLLAHVSAAATAGRNSVEMVRALVGAYPSVTGEPFGEYEITQTFQDYCGRGKDIRLLQYFFDELELSSDGLARGLKHVIIDFNHCRDTFGIDQRFEIAGKILRHPRFVECPRIHWHDRWKKYLFDFLGLGTVLSFLLRDAAMAMREGAEEVLCAVTAMFDSREDCELFILGRASSNGDFESVYRLFMSGVAPRGAVAKRVRTYAARNSVIPSEAQAPYFEMLMAEPDFMP